MRLPLGSRLLPASVPTPASKGIDIRFADEVTLSHRCDDPRHGGACWLDIEGKHGIRLSFDREGWAT